MGDGLFAAGMACPGDVGCSFAGEQEAVAGESGDGFLQRAIERDGAVELMGLACGDAQDDHLIGSGDKGFAFEADAVDFVGGAGAGGVEIELAAIVGGRAGMGEIDPQVAERLIGFGEEALHFFTELVGEVIVLMFEHGAAQGGEMVLRVGVVAVAGLAGPEGVLVELEDFFAEGAVFAASVDHGAETAVADGQRIDPLSGRFFVPEGQVAGRGGGWLVRGGGKAQALGERQAAKDGGGGSEKSAASESAHSLAITFRDGELTRPL